jgi:hypothetical protein
VREPVRPAGEDILFEGASSPFEPLEQASAGRLKKFELHWSAGLLLDHDRSLTNASSANDLSNLDLHQIATAKLAIDSKVEERAIKETMLLLQEETYGPYLLG